MNYVCVALGGAVGSLLRYWMTNLSGRFLVNVDFPLGTLIVNVIGCFLISFIGTWSADTLSNQSKLFLLTGILGGFTTFSAFGYETFYYLRMSQFFLAFGNICANVVLGVGAVILGYVCGRYAGG